MRVLIEVAVAFLLAFWIAVFAQHAHGAENVYAVVIFSDAGPSIRDYPTKAECLAAYRRNVMDMGLRLDPDECAEPIEKWKVEQVRGLVGPNTFTRE